MTRLAIPELIVGMVVVTPSSCLPSLTEDKRYVILDLSSDDWVLIQDDSGETRYYQAHLFIEANVYYSMLIWLTLVRMFDIPLNYI
jgi:hypothetical protein